MKAKPTNPPSMINELLCFALYSTSRSMNQLYRHYLKDLDISYPQLLVLILLWEKDQRTVAEFCEHMFLDTGTITPLLKRLQAKKLIDRRRSTQDERAVIISLTDAGRALQSQLPSLGENMLCDLDMTPEKVTALAQKIHRVRETIEESLAAKQQSSAS